MKKLVFAAIIFILFTGCSPKIGSDAWCTNMKDKPSGDWTLTETKEYAKSCVFK
jgi:hypothetical protein